MARQKIGETSLQFFPFLRGKKGGAAFAAGQKAAAALHFKLKNAMIVCFYF